MLDTAALERLAIGPLERGLPLPLSTLPVQVMPEDVMRWVWFSSPDQPNPFGPGLSEYDLETAGVSKAWIDGNHAALFLQAGVLVEHVERALTAKGACKLKAGGGMKVTVVNRTACYVAGEARDAFGWSGSILYVTVPRPDIRVMTYLSYGGYRPKGIRSRAIAAARAVTAAQAAKALELPRLRY